MNKKTVLKKQEERNHFRKQCELLKSLGYDFVIRENKRAKQLVRLIDKNVGKCNRIAETKADTPRIRKLYEKHYRLYSKYSEEKETASR